MTTAVRWTALISLALIVAGCAPNANRSSSPAGGTKKRSDGIAEARSDLGFLYFVFTEPVFGKRPERLPQDLNAAANAIKAIDERIFERVKSGRYVVRWGAALDEPVLAYERDAPTKGGWVLPGQGAIKQMTADELSAILGQKAD